MNPISGSSVKLQALGAYNSNSDCISKTLVASHLTVPHISLLDTTV
jgi:hypothetical protein